jgi:hypothetical protein
MPAPNPMPASPDERLPSAIGLISTQVTVSSDPPRLNGASAISSGIVTLTLAGIRFSCVGTPFRRQGPGRRLKRRWPAYFKDANGDSSTPGEGVPKERSRRSQLESSINGSIPTARG